MKQIILGLGFAVVVAASAFAQSGAKENVESVINQQIEAFQANDIERAFSFASPNLRTLFGSSRNFAAMVQQGYPMVWRPSEYEFGDLRSEGGRQYQTMIFTDQQGQRHMLEYELSDANGSWRIYSVVYLRQPDVGV